MQLLLSKQIVPMLPSGILGPQAPATLLSQLAFQEWVSCEPSHHPNFAARQVSKQHTSASPALLAPTGPGLTPGQVSTLGSLGLISNVHPPPGKYHSYTITLSMCFWLSWAESLSLTPPNAFQRKQHDAPGPPRIFIFKICFLI